MCFLKLTFLCFSVRFFLVFFLGIFWFCLFVLFSNKETNQKKKFYYIPTVIRVEISIVCNAYKTKRGQKYNERATKNTSTAKKSTPTKTTTTTQNTTSS